MVDSSSAPTVPLEASSRPPVRGSAPIARQFVRYLFFKVRPQWRGLSSNDRASGLAALLTDLEPFTERIAVLRAYNLLGTRGDSDFCFWMVSERLEDFQDVLTAIIQSPVGGFLETPYSYLAMTKRSQYIDKHVHEGQEGVRTQIRPTGRKYLFVYPLVKRRPWYGLPAEERQRIMDEHIAVGHEFPRVKINTTYSFGLDDQEFVVAFESDYPSDFLDLEERLRPTESSAYTERETPIFTCVAGSIAEVLSQLA